MQLGVVSANHAADLHQVFEFIDSLAICHHSLILLAVLICIFSNLLGHLYSRREASMRLSIQSAIRDVATAGKKRRSGDSSFASFGGDSIASLGANRPSRIRIPVPTLPSENTSVYKNDTEETNRKVLWEVMRILEEIEPLHRPDKELHHRIVAMQQLAHDMELMPPAAEERSMQQLAQNMELMPSAAEERSEASNHDR